MIEIALRQLSVKDSAKISSNPLNNKGALRCFKRGLKQGGSRIIATKSVLKLIESVSQLRRLKL